MQAENERFRLVFSALTVFKTEAMTQGAPDLNKIEMIAV